MADEGGEMDKDAASEYSMWGVFDKRDGGGGVHVAPCDAEGNIYPIHELNGDCLCRPSPMPGRVPIFVHGAIQ